MDVKVNIVSRYSESRKGDDKLLQMLSQTIVVGKKGVITIPVKMRDELGIEEGTALKVVMTDDGFLIIQPIGEEKQNDN